MKFKYKIILLPAFLFLTLCTSFLSGCSSGAQVKNYTENVEKIFDPLKESFNELDEKRSDLANGDLSKQEADQIINDVKNDVAGARSAFADIKTPSNASTEQEQLLTALDSFDKGLVLLQDASNTGSKIKRSLLIRRADREITLGFKVYNDVIADLKNKDG